MAKLRHIAITVPDPWKAAEFYMKAFGLKKVGETDWANARGVYLSDGTINIACTAGDANLSGLEDVAASRREIEAAGGKHWSGEPLDGGGFYEVKFHDPDGLVFDITENGWAGNSGQGAD